MIPESAIEPLDMESLADVEVDEQAAADAIRTTAVIKLNGGLGTSMGMDRAKSLLCVRRGLSFLDVIARQVLHLRQEYDAPLPLIFMNSFRTSADTMAAVARYEDLPVDGLPLEFWQNKEPKLLEKDLLPASTPRPRPRVVSARPRRRLHRAARHRPAGAADRARLRAGVRLQLRQPRRRARRQGRRLVQDVRDAVRDRGRTPHAVRPQGRPLRASQERRPHRAPRDRPDAARRPRGTRRPRPAPVLLDQQPLVRPRRHARGARPPRWHPRPAADPQREEPRPGRPVHARRSSRSRRRWAPRSRCSRTRAPSRWAATGSSPSRPPTTCWCFAPTSTTSARTSVSTRPPTCRTSSWTPTSTSSSATSTSASRRGRRRCGRRSSLKVEGDFTFGKGVQVVGDVELESGSAKRIAADTVLDG